jgi:peptidoglycan hydrolase CwlO-like protein
MKSGLFLLVFSLFSIIWPCFTHAQSPLTSEQRAELQRELAQVEAEQKQAAIELTNAQNKSVSLARDIAILDAKIRSAQLEIKAKNILIQSLGNDISKKVSQIEKLEDRIDKGRDTLAQILRKTNEVGELSIPEIILSRSSVTELVNDLDTFQSVQESLKETFEQLKSNKASTTAEKESLDNRRNAELDAKYVIQQQQKNIENNQTEGKSVAECTSDHHREQHIDHEFLIDHPGNISQGSTQYFTNPNLFHPLHNIQGNECVKADAGHQGAKEAKKTEHGHHIGIDLITFMHLLIHHPAIVLRKREHLFPLGLHKRIDFLHLGRIHFRYKQLVLIRLDVTEHHGTHLHPQCPGVYILGYTDHK